MLAYTSKNAKLKSTKMVKEAQLSSDSASSNQVTTAQVNTLDFLVKRLSRVIAALQEPVEVLNLKNKQKQTDTRTSSDSDEFNSFHFWRAPPLPLDGSLLDLLVSSSGGSNMQETAASQLPNVFK